MWTTLDDYRVKLPPSGRVTIMAPSYLRGGRASLLRPDGRLDPAAVRFVGQIARNAYRTGSIRETETGRRYPVLTSEVNGRNYLLTGQPSPDGRTVTLLAIHPEPRRFSGEFSDGAGHSIAQLRDYRWLLRQGLQHSQTLPDDAVARGDGIRYNQHQVLGVSGRTFSNSPDLSYPGYVAPGVLGRINVEIDTTDDGRNTHMATVIANDRSSMHIFKLVDPITGREINRLVYDPRTQLTRPGRANQRLPRPAVLPAAPNPQPTLPGLGGPRLPPPPVTPSPGTSIGAQLSLGLPGVPPAPAGGRRRRGRNRESELEIASFG